jgi:predicted permease
MRLEHWLYTIPLRLRSLFYPRRVEQELDEELRYHLQRKAEDYVAQGMPAEAAGYAALRSMDGLEQKKEQCREARRVNWLHDFVQDVRFGLRMLRKSPGFTVVAVLTLALGIGANTAIFGVVDSFLLRPLPVADPLQITILDSPQKQGFALPLFSIPDYRDLRDQTTDVFSGVFGYVSGFDGLSVNGKAERIRTCYVSENFFSTLGIKPALGRLLLPSEGKTPGADPVMVLSHNYWKQRFAADPAIVGTKVTIDGHPVTIVGVAPEGFYGVNIMAAQQAYLPLGVAVYAGHARDFMSDRATRVVYAGARLLPGKSVEQAQASLDVIARRLAQQYPDTDKDFAVKVFPELRARPIPQAGGLMVVISGLFLGLTAIVLLLACVNVANILLVRSTAREREMATRAALGAPRSRLLRQLLTESLLLALAGGGAGLLLGNWGTHALGSLDLHANVTLQVGLDWRILAYSLGVAVLAGFLVGVVPALRAARGDLSSILRAGGRGLVGADQRLRTVLVVSQVAGSLMLLIIAGLFVRSLGAAQQTNLGFNPGNVVNLSMDPQEIGYSPVQSREFYKKLLVRVRDLPGVLSVSTAAAVPMGYVFKSDTLAIAGYQPPSGEAAPNLLYNVISPTYFETMSIPLLRGRKFTDADDDKAQYVTIINETMAKRFWPGEDPLGRQFNMAREPQHPIQVVGIARDSRFLGVTFPISAHFYLPYAQHYTANPLETVQVLTAEAPELMISQLERDIAALAPDLPVFDAQTMTDALNTLAGLLIFKIAAVLAGVFGILGLILAVIGIYGVISYTVSQRTSEIGIRMALGADPRNILRMILGEGLMIVGAGLTIGLAGALLAARVVGNFVTVSATDPLTYGIVTATLTLVSLLACYTPARRATKVDPMIALRYE